MRRYLIDTAGNYVFWVPLVAVLNIIFSGWTMSILVGYAVTSLAVALVGGRTFTWFLDKVWYPIFWKWQAMEFDLWFMYPMNTWERRRFWVRIRGNGKTIVI